MRFAQFGDTHIGYKAMRHVVGTENVRTRDTRLAFETACDQIAERASALDFVIHTGDLFDHARPNYRNIALAIKGLRKIADTGLPLIMVAGNHDISRVKTAGSVFDIIKTAMPESVHIVSGFEVETIYLDIRGKRIRFVCIPYGAVMLGDLSYEYREGDADHRILIAHGTVEGAMPELEAYAGFDFSNVDIAPMAAPGGYLHFALGHLHTKGIVSHRTLYNGSTSRFGWSDKDASPGWWIVEATGDKWEAERMPLFSRRLVDLGERKIDYKRVVDTDGAVRAIASGITEAVLNTTELALQDVVSAKVPSTLPIFRVRLECNRADYKKIVALVNGEKHIGWNVILERSDAGDRGLPEQLKQINDGKAPLAMLLEQYEEKVLVGRYGNAEAERIGSKMLEYLERAEEERGEG